MRMRSIAFLLVATVLAAACGEQSRRSDDDDSSSPAASATTGTSGSGAAAGSGAGPGGHGGAGSGGSAPTLPVCLAACSVAADCDVGSGPAWDADNYTCDQGHCRYLGCHDDLECQAQGNLVCREAPNVLLGTGKLCVPPCVTVADCDIGGGAAYDADNYSCENGGCVYTGCNSDTECQTLGNLVCADFGPGADYCQYACTSAADCDYGGGPAYDADNYTCEGGVCVYRGCNSDTECQALGNYVCAEP